MARSRSVTCAGHIASSPDGSQWQWTVGTQQYQWCKLGHLQLGHGDGFLRIGFFREVKEAIAYTVGFQHGCVCAVKVAEILDKDEELEKGMGQ